ncbi:MAG: glycoside hydrolase, partial [Defluviitaleaceae bacterium]|nr:glycoside hydrolase [Defluviitaleaceae bacterium]
MIKLHTHTRSVADKHYDIWRSPGRFTKNPDVVRLSGGRLLLVYSDNDKHWSQETQILTVLASDDSGRTWFKLAEAGRADLRSGDERLVTPRLSALSDGRLCILVDHDDYGHFHEDQTCGNVLYWSYDGGYTWTGPHATQIPGFEPDRVVELPDGRLAVVVQVVRAQSQELQLIFTVSEDGGETWKKVSTVMHDGYHIHCEGGLILLDGGMELAVVSRENHSGGWPSFVSFSRDAGFTWTAPQMLPFHFHRPYGNQLMDGRVLITGRNLLGGVGTYAWCGFLKAEAGYYEIGGPLAEYDAEFINGEFVITNKPLHDCRYTLLPPESPASDIIFEADVKVEGANGEFVAFLAVSGLSCEAVVHIASDMIALDGTIHWLGADTMKKADMRKYRTVTLKSSKGILSVQIDGIEMLRRHVSRDALITSDTYALRPGRRTQFGQVGENGRSCWKRVSYRAINPTKPDSAFYWEAASGKYPDQYQRDRLTLVHPNVHP